jgi:uncharacterized protein (DUF58 family)
MFTQTIPEYTKLLPADLLAKFARGKFSARTPKSGFKNGDHRRPCIGSSSEFAEHREYSQGDDPRTLDWRVYARTDRYCVKKYVEETNLRATILLDCSASMGFCGEVSTLSDQGRLSKLDYANRLAAILAHLFIRQGDAVGLAQIDSQLRTFLPATSRPSHLKRILQSLHEQRPQNASRLPEIVHSITHRIPPRGIVILISDFLEELIELKQALHRLKHRNHELILFHVLAHEELTFPYDSSTRFKDLEEIADAMDVDPESIRKEYLHQFAEHLTELEKIATQARADYVRFDTRIPCDDVLATFLATKMRR